MARVRPFNDEEHWLERFETRERQKMCGRCPKCHPGKQWGGAEKCQVPTCSCHPNNR